MASKLATTKRRIARVRTKLKKVSKGRPRLSVFRSAKHISAQIIDDANGVTIASASSIEKDLRGKKASGIECAALIGKLVAERATKAGIGDVVFDRGGYNYHGRVKSLADAAREHGLKF